ncbi:protein of unknown function [Paraburkholderia dioscoreae]|uniref:Uncharacterized protein n=1 Tax=Paraburkholderia dioscoreae TaxID=2604047 RepID=A0A5Q4ZL28_9BURK|nr:protein of unknown function [Paraburkholderia dioscoreae]
MPGSCGCYNRQVPCQHGVIYAVGRRSWRGLVAASGLDLKWTVSFGHDGQWGYSCGNA